MAIRAGSYEVYGYNIPWFHRNFCALDRFFSVLFRNNLAVISLVDGLFYHTVHGWPPIILSKRLFRLCHPHMSQVVGCFDDSSLKACGNDDSVHSENQVIHCIKLMSRSIERHYVWVFLVLLTQSPVCILADSFWGWLSF